MTAPGSAPLVSVVVINYDKKEILRRCLQSALELDWPALEVICVDNASSDGSAEMVEAEFAGRVRTIRRTENSVTAARNDGYRAARGAFILSIDNDIVFPDPGVLRRGIRLFERFPEAGLLAFLIGTVEAPREPLPEHWWYEVPIAEGRRRSFFTRYFSEGAVLIRPEVIATTGGYDEDFFRGSENLDLSLKVHRDGWRILFSPELHCAELEVRGYIETKRSAQSKLHLRNKLWLVWKHFPWWRGIAWGGPRIATAAVRSLRYGWFDQFLAALREGIFAPRRIRRKRSPLTSDVWRRVAELDRGCFVDENPPAAPAAPPAERASPARRLLAVASGGGHFVQLLRLRDAFEGSEVTWVTTLSGYASEVSGPLRVVRDANLDQKLALVRMFLQMAWIVFRVRPHVIVTTGAAPGFAAVVLGRLTGARTVWIDSIANSETLSTSGAKVGRFADLWLTQWEHLARPEGPQYWGAVL